MPNDCMNTIKLVGAKSEILNFLDKYTSKRDDGELSIDFNKIIPEPKTIKECPEMFILHNEKEAREHYLEYSEDNDRRWFNWYDFHCAAWGTKWNAYDCQIGAEDILNDPEIEDDEEIEIIIDFFTAGGPAERIIDKLIYKNKNLEIDFVYFEPNMMLLGGVKSGESWVIYDGCFNEEAKEFCLDNELMDSESWDEYFGDFCENNEENK